MSAKQVYGVVGEVGTIKKLTSSVAVVVHLLAAMSLLIDLEESAGIFTLCL